MWIQDEETSNTVGATMKAYTNIKQSKKLADILPLDSADNTYKRVVIAGCNLDIPEEQQYIHDDTPFTFFSGVGVPCWSLAALLSVLPSVITRNDKRMFLTMEKAGAYNLYYKSPDRLDELWETDFEPIDACYEMILKLHEQKLL